MNKYESLLEACQAYFAQNPEAKQEKVILLWREEGGPSLSYYGGQASQLMDWPERQGQPMQHVLRLDLRQLPQPPADFLSLFVANPADNEAFLPFNDSSQLHFHTGQAAMPNTPPIAPLASQMIQQKALMLPSEIFGWEAPNEALKAIRQQLFNCSYLGGQPLWLQSDEHHGAFIGQFDEQLAPDLNLGDSGVMYLFEDTAFWQCY